jgi:hypothetical protein
MGLESGVSRMLAGNILFVVCGGVYLGWWVFCFRPVDPIKGMKTGWLLIPAALAGLAGVVCLILGESGVGSGAMFRNIFVLPAGIVAYVILFVITRYAFDRQVTSELFLIVIWGLLAVAEVNALYGLGLVPRPVSYVLFAVVTAVIVISMVCYVLYYRLSERASYIDGMGPLVLTGLFMAGMAVFIVVWRAHQPAG